MLVCPVPLPMFLLVLLMLIKRDLRNFLNSLDVSSRITYFSSQNIVSITSKMISQVGFLTSFVVDVIGVDIFFVVTNFCT